MEFKREYLKDRRGMFRTVSLFYEMNQDSLPPVFSLKEYHFEHEGVMYPSLKLIYLSYDDPTEYTFAMEVFGSWKQWQRIVNNAVLFKYVKEWRDELEVKIRSNAIKSIVRTSQESNPAGAAAAKWIAEKGYGEQKRGRPSKAEVEHTKRIHAGIKTEIDEDAERLGVKH